MPRRPSYLAREFQNKLGVIESTRIKVEALFLAGQFVRHDVEAVYAGLFIDAFTEFEALIESLFLGLFTGSLRSATQPTRSQFAISPKTHCRSIVFDGKDYADWLPIEDRTIPRANRFLSVGNPFSRLVLAEKQSLRNAHLLRNALAHKSDAATQRFLASINQQALLPHEKTPAGYLRTRPQGPSGITQFEIKMNDLIAVASKLCA